MGWMAYIKMLFSGKKVVEEAIEQGKLVKDVHSKSSFKSTEFWMAVLAGVGAVSAQAAGVVPEPFGAIVAAASGAFYAISRGLAKRDDPNGGVKPGFTTTEFMVSMLAQIATVIQASAGAVAPETATILFMVSNAAFGLSRGLAKGGAQPEPEAPKP